MLRSQDNHMDLQMLVKNFTTLLYTKIHCHKEHEEGHTYHCCHNTQQAQLCTKSWPSKMVLLLWFYSQLKMSVWDKLLYCRYHNEVTEFNNYFQRAATRHCTSPPGFLDMAKYRLQTCMSVTEQSVKEQIVIMFCSADGKLRIVVCTVASGMGLGLSQCTENHPLGAAGMMEACVSRSSLSDKQHTTKVMVVYCDNCRRQQLFTVYSLHQLWHVRSKAFYP